MRIRQGVLGTSLLIAATLLTCAGAALAQGDSALVNGDFEEFVDATAGLNNWTLEDPPRRPNQWSLNSAYPGEMQIRTDDPQSGANYLRIKSPEGGSHIFQIRDDLQLNQWYRISMWIRGGPVGLYVYEYFNNRPMRVPNIAQGNASEDEWREIFGYYRPDGGDYKNAGPAIAIAGNATADIDNIIMAPIELPGGNSPGPDVTFENDSVIVTLASNGIVKGFVSKDNGADYASPDVPFPIIELMREGSRVTLHSVAMEGDLLKATFLDTEASVTLRVTPDRRNFVFEVVEVLPADADSLTLEVPVRRMGTVGAAFNATYDDEFGMAMFGATINTYNAGNGRSSGSWSMRSYCRQEHGLVGAKFVLVAAPGDQFNDAIMEAERANGLPCPTIDGEWLRFSDFVRESYLFATSVHEDDIDKLIDYAKLGGFGTLIILKNSWLENHGHFDVNTASFPDGRAGLKRAVDKIHAAGLHAGVHVFGPSISANDPYVTPVPDDRLAFAQLPALAESIDAAATTITLAAEPENAPPKGPRSRAFPGYHVRIGDEIISYADAEVGPPFRYVGCVRGALGTTAAAHEAGTEPRHLLSQWGFFLVQPDSTLAEELTANFADVFNACDFDMAYFDASDGMLSQYMDRTYYLNKLHLGFWNDIGRDDVLYQTSNGTGSNIAWHIIPRSASADGHGDIKGYLDQRWPGILSQARNYTRSDIGWYYMFKDVRPDQIEYVRARALSIGGSISIEASRASLEALPLARQTFDMLTRYEQCRLAGVFEPDTLAKMQEPGKDFKLFPDGDDWQLYRAVYEEPRTVDALDGQSNVWTITNDLDQPCLLGAEIVRGQREVAIAGYDDPSALTIESFTDAGLYELSEENAYGKYIVGARKEIAGGGVVQAGVEHSFALSDDARVGEKCLVYSVQNSNQHNAWSGIGRRFDAPLDLSAYAGIGLWIHGDAKGEKVRVQLRDTTGRSADYVPSISFAGWSLHTFALPAEAKFDASKVEYLLFYFNNLTRNMAAEVRFDDVRALSELAGGNTLADPTLVVNGTRTTFPVSLEPGDAVSCEGPDGPMFWNPGMEPGRPLTTPTTGMVLQPGENIVTFEVADPAGFPGDAGVLLYRMWPMEE